MDALYNELVKYQNDVVDYFLSPDLLSEKQVQGLKQYIDGDFSDKKFSPLVVRNLYVLMKGIDEKTAYETIVTELAELIAEMNLIITRFERDIHDIWKEDFLKQGTTFYRHMLNVIPSDTVDTYYRLFNALFEKIEGVSWSESDQKLFANLLSFSDFCETFQTKLQGTPEVYGFVGIK